MVLASAVKLQASWLLGFIGIVFPVSARYSLDQEGSHICQNILRYQRPVSVAVRESFTRMYFIPCDNIFQLFMCAQTKTSYRLLYRQEFQQVQQTVRGCCPGFVQNGSLCTPCLRGTYGLNCSRTCPECLNGFGTCTPSDGACTCLEGYHGQHCDKGCRRGWYGKNCLHRCQCPRHTKCNRITGDCQCRSRRCAPLISRGDQVQIFKGEGTRGIIGNTAPTYKHQHWTSVLMTQTLSVLLTLYCVHLDRT